ncbi:MAG: 3-deoxy-manno-octulosonate-8-phosphatase KdsC [Pseudomonadales bacterium]|nr:3-deoxy-manno-octulosonate-8-phosphatase KdsC [Pseudomonadales bacterium]
MQEVIEKARKIKLMVFDVDGVLTNGQLFFTEDGTELKAFNSLDGHGIKMLHQAGIDTAIITGRTSNIVIKRAKDLGITHLYQGREDKLQALKELLAESSLSLEEVGYVGDDLPDLSAIRAVGLGIAVANAHSFVRKHADWQTTLAGGSGAARELCDLILDAQGKLSPLLEKYL